MPVSEEYALSGRDPDPGYSSRSGCDQSRAQIRPVFTNKSWINCIRLRSLRLELNCAIERCIRRVQFRFAFVPGTLKRYLRASKSVIITIAIHDSLLKSASMIAG